MIIELKDKNITKFEKDEIVTLLKRQDERIKIDLIQMWYLMDLIWDDYKCDNKNLNWEEIGQFYSHPVWLLNGLFQEQDTESMRHRHAISNFVVNNKLNNVVDYGGGFGTLSRLIAQKNFDINIDIYEPHPSDFGLKRVSEYNNISIINTLNTEYDCLLSTDVLEHVPDPLEDFAKMINSVKVGGYLVIANSFYPVIKCHLPQDFHFRYSFNIFAKLMGLKLVGQLKDSHATIFIKRKEVQYNWRKIRFYENFSKTLFPIIECPKNILRYMKRLIVK